MYPIKGTKQKKNDQRERKQLMRETKKNKTNIMGLSERKETKELKTNLKYSG